MSELFPEINTYLYSIFPELAEAMGIQNPSIVQKELSIKQGTINRQPEMNAEVRPQVLGDKLNTGIAYLRDNTPLGMLGQLASDISDIGGGPLENMTLGNAAYMPVSAIGELLPQAKIIGTREWSNPSNIYWTIEGTSDLRGKRFDSFDKIREFMIGKGYAVPEKAKPVGEYNPYVSYLYETEVPIIHEKAASILKEQKKAWDIYEKDGKDVFLRFGNIPKSGKSINYADKTTESGVSVFNGKLFPDGKVATYINTPQQSASNLHFQDRPLYIVSGDFVGPGSDGEPLLSNTKIIRKALLADDSSALDYYKSKLLKQPKQEPTK